MLQQVEPRQLGIAYGKCHRKGNGGFYISWILEREAMAQKQTLPATSRVMSA